MTWTAVPHTVHRLVVHVDLPFDEFRACYEQAVPTYDITGLARFSTWAEVRADADRAAPNGFLRYSTVDCGPAFSIAGHKAQCVVYLMGNHTIAEHMFHHDPAAMLHAPLRTLIYADPDGDTKLAVDQPSLLFASYHNPDIETVGYRLDYLLALLIINMGADLPSELRHTPS